MACGASKHVPVSLLGPWSKPPSLSLRVPHRICVSRTQNRSRTLPYYILHRHREACTTGPSAAVGSHEAEQVEELMPEPLKSSAQRGAALHDFCLAIPYGIVLLLCGAVSLLVGSGWSGARTLAAGCVTLGLANVSLQIWRAGRRNIWVTFLEAGIAAGITAAKFQRVRMVQMPWVRWSNFALSGLSGAMFLFLAYNILAGGNPLKPPKTASEEGDNAAIPAASG